MCLIPCPERTLDPDKWPDRQHDAEAECTEADRRLKEIEEMEPMSPVAELAFCVGYLKSKGVI